MLFPLKKPKWQHHNPTVRLNAVEKIDPSQVEVLCQIVLQDEDPTVREAALDTLEDLAALDQIAAQSPDPRVVRLAGRKSEEKRVVLLQSEGDLETHLEHLARINSTTALVSLACTSWHIPIRLRCLDRLHQQADLEQVAMGQCGRSVAEALIGRIDNGQILSRLSLNGGSKLIRRLSEQKLKDNQQQETEDKTDQSELRAQQLVDTASRLSSSLEWDLARQRLSQLKTEWDSLAGLRHQQLAARFYEAVARFERRHAEYLLTREEGRQQEEKARQLQAQFSDILRQIRQLPPPDGTSSPLAAVEEYRSRGERLLEKMPATALTEELQGQLAETCRQIAEKCSRYTAECRKAEEYEGRFIQKKETIQDPALLLEELHSLQKAIGSAEWHQYQPVALKGKIEMEMTALASLLKGKPDR